MKIAITGSSGYIAEYLSDRFLKMADIDAVIKIGRRKDADYFLDLNDASQFDYSVLKTIDYVIFTAAVSSPDKCADEYEAGWKINVTGTIYFIQRAIDMGCRVLFFSSDAVYGNVPGHIYSEQDKTEAETPYGKMKKAVEDGFRDNHLFKALRLSYVVSAKDKFVSYCIKCMEKKEQAEIFHPFYRNCITLCDVGNIVVWLLENWDRFAHTFLNAAGEELVSRIRIADEINRIANEKLQFEVVHPGQSFYYHRPKITQMESIYIPLYNILERKSFSQKFQKELEGYINEEK